MTSKRPDKPANLPIATFAQPQQKIATEPRELLTQLVKVTVESSTILKRMEQHSNVGPDASELPLDLKRPQRYQRVLLLGGAVAVSVKLDDALKSRVQHLAASQRRSAHWIMREAIQQYVEREEARESFRQEALTSWAEYQQSGQHLTGAETRDWLRGWGNEEGNDAPACHE